MNLQVFHERLSSLYQLRTTLRAAAIDLFSQEFSYSTGYFATILNGCLFAPSLLTFWFVNGLIDFSTAITIGAVATPAGLQTRLLAYVLPVPAFFLVRVGIQLLHPAHRRQILAGSCPNARLLSLDWFGMGILATGHPLGLRDTAAQPTAFVFAVSEDEGSVKQGSYPSAPRRATDPRRRAPPPARSRGVLAIRPESLAHRSFLRIQRS